MPNTSGQSGPRNFQGRPANGSEWNILAHERRQQLLQLGPFFLFPHVTAGQD